MNKRILLLAVLCAIAVLLLAPPVISNGGEHNSKECNDKIDNDGDGLIDLADPGCERKSGRDETNCGDGVCEGPENALNCEADCEEEFCGWSTYASCKSDKHCVRDGCNAEVCKGFKQPGIITPCIIQPCADATAYNMECGCVNDQCQWRSA